MIFVVIVEKNGAKRESFEFRKRYDAATFAWLNRKQGERRVWVEIKPNSRPGDWLASTGVI